MVPHSSPRLVALASLLLLPSLLALGSCAADPVKVFEIHVMDVEEHSVPAIIVVGDDWQAGVKPEKGTAKPYLTNQGFAKVPVSFEKSDSVRIRVRDVELDEQGRITRGMNTEDPSEYKLLERNTSRMLKRFHSEVQTFFLERK